MANQQIDSSHELVARDIDLVFSPDDEASNGKGFYFHRYKPRDETSQLFESREEALNHYAAGLVEWEA